MFSVDISTTFLKIFISADVFCFCFLYVKESWWDLSLCSLACRFLRRLSKSFIFLPLDLPPFPLLKLKFLWDIFDRFLLVCVQGVYVSFHWISFQCGENFQLLCSSTSLFCCIWGCFSSIITLVITSTTVYMYLSNSCVGVVLLSL